MTERRATYVYFIASDDGFIKIGHSHNPDGRLEFFRYGNPHHLRILHAAKGSQWNERWVHHRFLHLHVRQEWFQATDDLVAFITELKAGKVRMGLRKDRAIGMYSKNPKRSSLSLNDLIAQATT
jgi:hypothetical protein